MCGIGGVYNFRSGAPAERAVLSEMGGALEHRGPDGQGIHTEGALGLVHRRLAIIDLEGGSQPMSTPDEQSWIAYNGEVYNYLELLAELRSAGHEVRTRSDTEAVLLAYRQWGLDFATRLNGMFALAIWDARERRLVLARDRLGIKPLYYAPTSGGIAFASEIKALRALPGLARQLDHERLSEFLTTGYVVNPASLVRGVHKLSPGSVMTVDAATGPRERRYWTLAFRPERDRSVEDWREEVRESVTDSVRLQLRSDVPVGTLLSGGVDSTLIASTMARLGGGADGIDSFCIGVDAGGAQDDFEWARRVAARHGLRHHEIRLTAGEHGEALVDACRLLDEPLAEPMVGQLLAVCRVARQRVKVLLSGEGADETWLGYPGYRVHHAIELAQGLLPAGIRRGAAPPAEWAARWLPQKPAKYLRLLFQPLERRYLGVNQFDVALQRQLYGPALREALAHFDARGVAERLYDEAGGPEALSRMAALDSRAWLVDNTLLRSDQMSMAASLELRVPFLDHRLVELACRVPAGLKVGWDRQKKILADAFPDLLPRALARRRKLGFPTPLRELFRTQWGERARDVLATSGRVTADLFDRQKVLELLDRHRRREGDWSRVLFQLLVLEYWARGLESSSEAA